MDFKSAAVSFQTHGKLLLMLHIYYIVYIVYILADLIELS